jgi:TPR repeat protein
MLAMLYRNGDGIKQDYFEAIKWYKKSAEQGVDIAQYDLACILTA